MGLFQKMVLELIKVGILTNIRKAKKKKTEQGKNVENCLVPY